MKIKPILALIWGLLFCVPAHAAQLSIGIGTTANDGTGDTARVAFGKVNTNFTELYDSVADLATDLADLAVESVSIIGDESIDGQKTFAFAPAVTVLDLAGGTTLAVGKSYRDSINVDRAITFSGSPAEGTLIKLQLVVTGTPTITFPTSKRAGENGADMTSIRLWEGLHSLLWDYTGGTWWLYDSIYAKNATTTLDPTINSDADQGYGPGSVWTNTTDNGIFVCSSAANGAAVWKEIGVATGSGTREYILPIQPDETTTLTTGTGKYIFRAPANITITGVRASLATSSSSGLPTFDVNVGDSPATILSTKITVDASEKTSVTAAAAPVISSGNVAVDAQVSVDVDVAGTGATGAKVYLTAIPWDGVVPVTDYLTNLIARVGFEEGTGTSFADTVGTLGTGTGNAASALVAGKVGTWALQMDALEAVNFGDTAIFDGRTAMTLSYWWRRDAAGSGSDTYMLRKLTNSGNMTLVSYLLNSTTPRIELRTNTVPATVVSQSATTITNTAWHHTALVYTGSVIELWVDGVKVDNDAQSGTTYNSSGTFWIGPITSGAATVTIDDFRLYSTALGSSELATIIAAANP